MTTETNGEPGTGLLSRQRKYSRLAAFAVSSLSLLSCAMLLPAQDDRIRQREIHKDQAMELVVKKLQQYQGKVKSIEDIGGLTGLWRKKGGVREGESDIRQIYQLRDVMTFSYVNTTTGKLNIIGFAEQKNNVWDGWWSLACRDCCPGVGWWDRGAFVRKEGGADIVAKSLKMDPNACTLTDTPDTINVDLELIRTMRFKEFLPGKLIHIVAAPAVGGQAAQYKAAVKPTWDLRGLGVSHFTLAVKPGGVLINDSKNLTGEYEYHTTRAGKYFFVLMAENQEGKLLHFDIRSIEIPPIPGINR